MRMLQVGGGIDAASTSTTLIIEGARFDGNLLSPTSNVSATVSNPSFVRSGAAIHYRTSGEGTPQGSASSTFQNVSFERHSSEYPTLQIIGSVRWRCPLGTYMPLSGTFTGNFSGCLYSCPAGRFGPSPFLTRAEDCSTCPDGHFCIERSEQPVPCPAGTYLPLITGEIVGYSRQSCIPCIPGTASNATAFVVPAGGTSCPACPAGKFSTVLRATACESCPAGGYCAAISSATIAQAFTRCPVGSWNPDKGASHLNACRLCPPGKSGYSSGSTSLDECVSCPRGTYNPLPGGTFAGACLPCPTHSDTRSVGSTTKAHCTCLAHYYDANASVAVDGILLRTSTKRNAPVSMIADVVDCRPCPVGTKCIGGATLHELPLKIGYWRPSPRSIDVRRCADAEAGCAHEEDCDRNSSLSGCAGGTALDSQCATGSGLSGPFCVRGSRITTRASRLSPQAFIGATASASSC